MTTYLVWSLSILGADLLVNSFAFGICNRAGTGGVPLFFCLLWPTLALLPNVIYT